ncbi:DUF805 domain-containing protein [Jiella avicenniae]|uniref:DUF805 domain-containing protein n=1 Tax=Jiella avicenniae TaxID=2907202 RepID=A0A9X1T5F7_9HYPH|nr:DUF805 domain-containing protein [Jiella avicenniae]MCE7029561.1 DUF805 domain-containing protein [Jiella avicenniae]
MQSFLSFHGRIGRTTYWMAVLTCSLLYLGGAAMIVFAGTDMSGSFSAVAGFALVGAGAWVSWATTVTRLHDLDRSGFYALVTFVPGGGVVLMAFCGFAAGSHGMNHYGSPPGLGGLGYLDEAMAAFEEPEFERRSGSAVREAAARETAAGPTAHRTPPRTDMAPTNSGHRDRGARPGFGRRRLSPA